MKMLIQISIGALIAVAGVTAAAARSDMQSKSFLIGKKSIPFEVSESRHLTISADCVTDGRLKSCDASAALKLANAKKMKQDAFGRNPGAMICSEQVGGSVVWSVDSAGNERTFCAFHDGSIVGTGTLAYYGMQNSEKRQNR